MQDQYNDIDLPINKEAYDELLKNGAVGHCSAGHGRLNGGRVAGRRHRPASGAPFCASVGARPSRHLRYAPRQLAARTEPELSAAIGERVELDDEKVSDHFEVRAAAAPAAVVGYRRRDMRSRFSLASAAQNIQSTNWQTVRFKPPPPNTTTGWRVEFRSMEVQPTDFENAAFTVFIALLSR